MSLHRARLCVLVATATAAGLLLSAAPARADSVSDWDAIAATAVTGPPSNQGAPAVRPDGDGSCRDVRRRERHRPSLQAIPVITASQAMVLAGRGRRDRRVPHARRRRRRRGAAARWRLERSSRRSTTRRSPSIAAGPARSGGVRAGEAAAWAMIAARTERRPLRGAGVPRPAPWAPRPGARRLAANASGVNDPAAWLRNVEPFFVHNPDRFLSRGPNALTSRAYAREYAEVKLVGQERQHDAQRGSDRRGALLGRGQRGRDVDYA